MAGPAAAFRYSGVAHTLGVRRESGHVPVGEPIGVQGGVSRRAVFGARGGAGSATGVLRAFRAGVLKIPLSWPSHVQLSPPFSNLAASKLMVFVHIDQEPAIGIVTKRLGILRHLRSPYSLQFPIQPSQCAVRNFVLPAVSAVEELAISVVGPNEWRIPTTECAGLMLYAAHGSSSLPTPWWNMRTSAGCCQTASAACPEEPGAAHPALHCSLSRGPNFLEQRGLRILRYVTKHLTLARNLQPDALAGVPVPGPAAGGRSANLQMWKVDHVTMEIVL